MRKETESLETRMQKSQLRKRCVTIYIWTSRANQVDQGHGCGHAAIQTPTKYISLWPSDKGKEEGSGLWKGIDKAFIPSYKIDTEKETRPAELVFRFYTLNVERLEERFDELRREVQGWAAMPALLLFQKNVGSCVTTVWKCLVAGNIGQYAGALVKSAVGSEGVVTGSQNSSQAASKSIFSWFAKAPKDKDNQYASQNASLYSLEHLAGIVIKNPDYCGNLLKEAKANELNAKPITRALDEAFETQNNQETQTNISLSNN